MHSLYVNVSFKFFPWKNKIIYNAEIPLKKNKLCDGDGR